MIEYLPANSQPQISIAPSNHATLNPLAEISRQVSDVTDLNDLLDLLCDEALRLSGADRALMVLLENSLPVRLNYQGFAADFDFSAFEETWEQGVEQGTSLNLADKTLAWANYRNDPQIKYDPTLSDLARKLGGAAWLVVPFKLNQLNSGLIWLIKDQSYEWPGSEVAQIEDFGVIAGLALQNSRMQQSLQREREHRAKLVTLARTAAHDLNQQLSVLQAEIDLAVITGQATGEELLNRLQMAVEKMTERVRAFQKTVRAEDR